MKSHFRIIGDVHGKAKQYANLISEVAYSVQVGDMGFDYSHLASVDSDRHKVIGGNHDNYTKSNCHDCKGNGCLTCNEKGYVYCQQPKHFLGDYGTWKVPDFGTIFFCRGAWSIDRIHRTPEVSWWQDEEIPYSTMLKALDFYKSAKPDLVITHTCPLSIAHKLTKSGEVTHNPNTERLLQCMYDEWQPSKWFFGHWHIDWANVVAHPTTHKETKFICLNELSYHDLTKP